MRIDLSGEIQQIYLKPGELCISDRPVRITTVLGSCVSVTMFHPAGIGAICHALQPACPLIRDCSEACCTPFKYADCVVAEMTKQLKTLGIFLKEVEVKLFGGAAMLGADDALHMRHSVGKMNVTAAMDAIAANGLSLKVADVGGRMGRKIIFNTQTGVVLLKRIKRVEEQVIARSRKSLRLNNTQVRMRSKTFG